ncbi:response regulator [Candidatus Woesearchaeota archaeon]|nr:response regulator [Candidatus Woesearchaeota archaeon]
MGDISMLIIDDERSNREFFTIILKSEYPSLTIHTAADAKEALDLLGQEGQYELVLSDNNLKCAMSGVQVYLETVKTRPEYTDRFVFMSGLPEDVMKELRSIPDEHRPLILTKPISIDTLVNTVRSYLGSDKRQ